MITSTVRRIAGVSIDEIISVNGLRFDTIATAREYAIRNRLSLSFKRETVDCD